MIIVLSNIRVTYSGLIGFLVGIISVITGLIFILIVTRRLSPDEFGVWSLIGNMIFYFLITERIISFWTVRQIARDEKVGKTSIVSSTFFSFVSIPLYLVFSYFISIQTNTDSNLMMLGGILIPVQYISQTFANINLAHKPHARSYGLLVFESLKIPTGLGLVYFFDLGVQGAIFTIFLAYVGRIIIQYYFAKPKLEGKFHFKFLKKWMKTSWLPLYSYLTNSIWSIDVVVYSLITGSVIGVAYYSASLAISGILKHSGLISQALYPKLLAKGNFQYIQDNLSRLMFFSIPLLGIAVVFSKPALFALNPAYEEAWIIVIILSFKMFFWVFRDVLDRILLGIETIDVEQNFSFEKLSKSKLFFVPTRKIIHFGLYIISIISVLFVLKDQNLTEFELVQWWAIVGLTLEVPFFIYLFLTVRKSTRISFPYHDAGKYVLGTIIFGIVYFITSDLIIIYEQSIYFFLPRLLIQLIICTGVYLGLTYVIDKKTRVLTKTILSELLKK